MNKKGQLGNGIIAFIVIIFVIILLAPFMLKIVNNTAKPFSNALQTVDPLANQTGTHIVTKFTTMWDYVIMAAFAANILVLLVSVFLIDVHPAFLIIYILTAAFSLIFAPSMYNVLDEIYDPAGAFADEVASIPMTSFIYDHFGVLLLSVLVLSGIIMYAKFKSMRSI